MRRRRRTRRRRSRTVGHAHITQPRDVIKINHCDCVLLAGDAETGQIYKNAHGKENDKKSEKPEEEAAAAQQQVRKEKSVLQAKLTKLAIQIGYAGACCECV